MEFQHTMPKDLKLFLAALVGIPVLLLTVLIVFFFSGSSQNDIIATDLELNRFKMTTSIQENQSWLKSEIGYLKATLTRKEAENLNQWLKRYHRSDTPSSFAIPEKLEGHPDWQPLSAKNAVRGHFFVKGSYHWHCSYLIAPIDKNTSVFYLYAIDYFDYKKEPPAPPASP